MAEARGSRSDAQLNLGLEVVSLLLLFGSLAILVVVAVAVFTIVGTEQLSDGRADLSTLQQIVFTPAGYSMILLMYSIPIVLAICAGIGIRKLLVRPEPPPDPLWEVDVDKPQDSDEQ